VTNDDGSVDILTDPVDFSTVKGALESAAMVPELAEITMRASVTSPLAEKEATSMMKLLEMLEDLDDVQNVYSNADIPDEILQNL